MQSKLSVCLAVYNEEKNLKRCLEAIIGLADEIVIVDGQSTDQTVKIAKQFGTKVKLFSYPNPPNFLLNRQRAIDKATSDWILVLDADEVVSGKLKQEIKNLLASAQAQTAFYVPRLNYFLGAPLRKGGVYPDYCLRLFRRGSGKIPLKSVHDQLVLNDKQAAVGYLQNDLAHYAYPSFQVYLRKWIQYCDHEADLLKEKKTKLTTGLLFKYCLVYPKWWFLKTYFRHKGFQDRFPGFVFSLFSALRFIAIYIKLYEKETR